MVVLKPPPSFGSSSPVSGVPNPQPSSPLALHKVPQQWLLPKDQLDIRGWPWVFAAVLKGSPNRNTGVYFLCINEYIYIYIPRTQLALVLIEKGLVLEG